MIAHDITSRSVNKRHITSIFYNLSYYTTRHFNVLQAIMLNTMLQHVTYIFFSIWTFYGRFEVRRPGDEVQNLVWAELDETTKNRFALETSKKLC